MAAVAHAGGTSVAPDLAGLVSLGLRDGIVSEIWSSGGMRSDAGHVETQTALPEPLASTGFWNIGSFALPATLLSFSSLVVFALVFLFLQSGDASQELFVLPFPGTSLFAAAGAALGWFVVWSCRNRPGKLWPRLWALIVACSSSAITLLGLAFHDRSWALALAVGASSAAMVLAARLIKLSPNSALVQLVAPLTLLILLIIVPSSCAVRRAIARKTEERVDHRIQQIRVWTMQVQKATNFDWSRMEDSPSAAAKAVESLTAVHFEGIDDAELWQSASILGKHDDLVEAMQGLTEAVVAGFAPQRVPRVSNFREAAIRWDDQENRWQAYTKFSTLSAITGAYHQELGRLFGELESRDETGVSESLVDYQQHYAEQRTVLKTHLEELANSWADHWAVFKVPQHEELIGLESAPLDTLLRASFARSDDRSLAAAELWRLTSLPLFEVKRLAQGSPGCEDGQIDAQSYLQSVPRSAPGCHCQNFDERDREYFRLDCYSYTPRKEGSGAELRIEMRLVYQSSHRHRLSSRSLPYEVFFHFIIPDGKGSDAFREEVMTALAAAARSSMPEGGSVRSTDRGGSVAGGFTLVDRNVAVRVPRPAVVTLTGLTPEPQALQVRVLRGTEGRVRGG
jgi:hypothetical protein